MQLTLAQRASSAVGLDKRRRADRRLLEGVISPWLLAQQHWHRVLFVGCAWYTQRSQALFARKEFMTLEADARAARHGARRHIVCRLGHLDRLLAPAALDVIVCNGVLGWSLDEPAAVNAAFAACHATLRPVGPLLVGCNDTRRRQGRALMQAPALERFASLACPPLGAAVVQTGSVNRHAFSFFMRP